jgi:hypothetical protein
MGTKRGCDHGLGGRDNEKSRQRRAKRAAVTKKIALSSLKGGPKKREIIFDEAARVDFLTGFRKRKQERRKYGLTKQIEKEQKHHKDEIKSRRQAVKEVRSESGQKLDEIIDELKVGERKIGAKIGKQMVFEDDQTMSMFGDAVTVVVDTAGLADQLEQHSFPADSAAVGVAAGAPGAAKRTQPYGKPSKSSSNPKKFVDHKKQLVGKNGKILLPSSERKATRK